MSIVPLIESLVNALLQAEEKFYQNPKDFYSLETSVKASTEAFSAAFLGNALTEINKKIYEDGWRKNQYIVQRNDTRTLISSVGDVTFESTYYRKKEDGSYHYLVEEVAGIDSHERFTEAAEVALLTEAEKTSYSEAAKVLPSKQKISKTTVLNKIHGLTAEMPYEAPAKRKICDYLFIEADEDHIAEQHGRWSKEDENKGFISKLVYVYEYKQESPTCEKRKELVNTFYFGGIYAGSKENERFWYKVSDYIEKTYDTDKVKKIYLIGDGGTWLTAGTKYLVNALFCFDKYHLMKYINHASNQMLDDKDMAKSELYRMLYGKDKVGFRAYTDKMKASANNITPIEALQTLVLNNWAAVMRTYHNKHISGCSAEGHVSHVLSDRLSSRPMGWSQTGADGMSKLRCYKRNYGREKIIDLVQYTRKQRKLAKTGTDDVVELSMTGHDIARNHYDQARSYIERMQATIPYGTVRKIASIREQIKLI